MSFFGVSLFGLGNYNQKVGYPEKWYGMSLQAKLHNCGLPYPKVATEQSTETSGSYNPGFRNPRCLGPQSPNVGPLGSCGLRGFGKT